VDGKDIAALAQKGPASLAILKTSGGKDYSLLVEV